MEDQKQQLAQQQQQLLLMQQQMQRRNDAVSRFPSNIDAHLRPSLLQHHRLPQNPNPNSNPNPHPHPQINPNSQNQQPPIPTTTTTNAQIQSPVHQQQQQQQKAALQLAYQDAWRVCHPDFKRPFSSLEDACERLLPYHVVADYEAEEDDKILDSDSTGQILSRSQQWDHNIAAKVSEFTATFEKQVLAFNIISKKRSLGEFRTEEKLMMEQLLLQDEKRALLESRAARMEDSRQKASRETQEAQMRMAAAMEQARVESQAHHAELMARAAPIRANALGPRGGSGGIDMGEQDQEDVQHEEAINGWGGNAQKDDKDEPSEDFLNDDETDNGDTALQGEWQGGGEFDLNAR